MIYGLKAKINNSFVDITLPQLAEDVQTALTNVAATKAQADTAVANANTAIQTANTAVTNAQSYANTASGYADDASDYADNASASAGAAASSATTAANQATTATTQAGIATTKANEASTSATNASTYLTRAKYAAEGTDSQASTIGLTHSSKVWATTAQGYVTQYGSLTASASTLTPGSSASATFTPATGVLSIGVPTTKVQVGTVTTGEPGTSAVVTSTESGTTTTLDFTIPRGYTGSAANLPVASSSTLGGIKLPTTSNGIAISGTGIISLVDGVFAVVVDS